MKQLTEVQSKIESLPNLSEALKITQLPACNEDSLSAYKFHIADLKSRLAEYKEQRLKVTRSFDDVKAALMQPEKDAELVINKLQKSVDDYAAEVFAREKADNAVKLFIMDAANSVSTWFASQVEKGADIEQLKTVVVSLKLSEKKYNELTGGKSTISFEAAAAMYDEAVKDEKQYWQHKLTTIANKPKEVQVETAKVEAQKQEVVRSAQAQALTSSVKSVVLKATFMSKEGAKVAFEAWVNSVDYDDKKLEFLLSFAEKLYKKSGQKIPGITYKEVVKI